MYTETALLKKNTDDIQVSTVSFPHDTIHDFQSGPTWMNEQFLFLKLNQDIYVSRPFDERNANGKSSRKGMQSIDALSQFSNIAESLKERYEETFINLV